MTLTRSPMLRQPIKEIKPSKGPRTKRCGLRGCPHRFVPNPAAPLVTWCSVECGAAVALAKSSLQKLKAARAGRAIRKRELAETKLKLAQDKPLAQEKNKTTQGECMNMHLESSCG